MADQTNEPFDTIEPAEITLTRDTSAVSIGANRKPLLVYLGATTLLLALAITFVVFYAPAENGDADSSSQNLTVADATTGDKNTTATAGAEPPFLQQQNAAQRRAAQDALARIIELQKYLAEKNVSDWAETEFERAQDSARRGDQQYQRREFSSAQSHYESSASQLETIKAGIGPLIEKSLAAGMLAINSGDLGGARAAYNRVLNIEPNHAEARQGLLRANQLPQVLALVEAAAAEAENGDYAAAVATYGEALAIDGQYPPAIIGAATVNAALRKQQFHKAMDSGYAQLSQGHYAGAAQAFRRAAQIDATSTVATQALAQVENEQQQHRLQKLLAAATHSEQNERWQNAVDEYAKILAIDSTVVAAKVGKIRSTARLRLDGELEKIIADPVRLSTKAVYRQAQQLLADAEQVQPNGPRLRQQAATVKTLLVYATTPLPVTLLSDNATTVTLLRVGKLGQFEQRTLELTPGRYVAEGYRPGFRDVRIDFVVDGKDNNDPILIVCREPV